MTPIPIMRRLRLPCAPRPGAGKRAPLTRLAAGEDLPDAYERLITDVIRGNQTLFMRGDEVEAAWAWADPIVAAWAGSSAAPAPYDAGSAGPAEAAELMKRDGRRWREMRD